MFIKNLKKLFYFKSQFILFIKVSKSFLNNKDDISQIIAYI